jgi:hypothetical protein
MFASASVDVVLIASRVGMTRIMTTIGDTATFRPEHTAPVSGFYQCDSECGHQHRADVAGHVLPSLPEGCVGDGWRLGEQRFS